MEHDGTHALVTGGGTGIGEGIARGLAEAGAQVTITGRRADVLAAVAASHPNLHALPMDVSDEFSVREGIAEAARLRGPIQICVANAGIAEGGPFAKVSLADWRRIMTTNLDGVFLTLQSALATLPADAPARMIVISSIAGLRGLKGAVSYTASKHAVIGLVRGLSEEYMRRPITFNAIFPGYVDTDMVRAVPKDVLQLWTKYDFRAGPLAGWSVGGGLRDRAVDELSHLRIPRQVGVDVFAGISAGDAQLL